MSYARPRKYVAAESNVDTSTLVLKSGDTMTGVLTLASGGITTDSQTYTATELKTALNAANAALPKSGGTLTGALTLASGGITTDSQTFTAAQVKNAISVGSILSQSSSATYTVTHVTNPTSYSASGTYDILMGSTATAIGSVLPAGRYTFSLVVASNPSSIYNFNGTTTVITNGTNNIYTDLVVVSKGSSVSSVAVAPSTTQLLATYTVANTNVLQWGRYLTLTRVSDLSINGLNADSSFFSAAQVKNALNLPVTGGTMGGLLTLNTSGIRADSQTYTANQLKTALNAANNALPLAGGTLTGTTNISGGNFIMFGSGVAGKDSNAGKIGYETFTSGHLDIIGAGALSGNRNIKIWDNLTTAGSLNVTGLLTISSTGLSASSTTFTAAEVKNALNLTKTGGTVGGLLTLNTAGISTDSTTFTATEVKNGLNLTKTGGTMGGLLTLASTGLSTDSTTFTAAEVKNGLNLGKSGGINASGCVWTYDFSIPGATSSYDISFSAIGSPVFGMYMFTLQRTTNTEAGNHSGAGIFFSDGTTMRYIQGFDGSMVTVRTLSGNQQNINILLTSNSLTMTMRFRMNRLV